MSSGSCWLSSHGSCGRSLAKTMSGIHYYRTRPGDTLTSLSRAWYGDKCHAMTIFAHNRDVLTDPNVLPPNVTICRPHLSPFDKVYA